MLTDQDSVATEVESAELVDLLAVAILILRQNYF